MEQELSAAAPLSPSITYISKEATEPTNKLYKLYEAVSYNPPASLTFTSTVSVPDVVGVPESFPELLIDNQEGPSTILYVNASPSASVAKTVVLYAVFAFA